ncbi:MULTISPECIES: tripartite tricarboxylate transporter substrate binding protein [unclassified Polaromonas]|jgi:tripartite-type tricarboxylate transporter receptor subunit TctC|uniref:Bug family tripartite tricarboxylate transporter substrate binding protein n=1 Tax=unclassified Polaromonas TaxID=2638319 RepID=UPI000BDDA646|nr:MULTISPECIES: tripartite tricarboxylate transporter substrate binding protein [unclassified Polaromonas]OYY38082.1 MAG: ABC transporter substrate-binding protein [Polaromonas sp. 35-63-35]OYZ18524.1 MAG: ABC transporter substrate-binding protein [Polaromonas sp. 16-63-31]OYZ79631.1 MAG: ABC transporter substrate-binding protein [Polaromonas sp. 24-63-21]OZA50777.1 MAG: ABC transporter substrate-binding protein [Polaromonas sp. 17-63-33]OZA89635.1 MAG: ABC transporter substrate-binding prote
MSPFFQPGRRTLLALALIASSLFSAAQAQTWPAKPVKVIVNFPPGGAADQLARAIGTPLAEALSQPVVVENRGGANGNIGGEAVAKAPADGYTLLMSSGGMVSVNPHLYPKMSFNPAKDLVPVAAAARVLVFLEVKPTLPVNNVKEFLAYLKANPGKLSFGSPGNGSSPHLAAEMLKAQTNSFAVHVPYRGAAPAMQDLLGGQLDFMFDPGIGLQHVKAGKLKLLAVGSAKRSPLFPDVPTLDEAGLKNFDADTWFGFYAPAGTPPAVVSRLNQEINKILATQPVKDRIMAIGGIPAPMSPSDFNMRAAIDGTRFGALIRARNIKAE